MRVYDPQCEVPCVRYVLMILSVRYIVLDNPYDPEPDVFYVTYVPMLLSVLFLVLDTSLRSCVWCSLCFLYNTECDFPCGKYVFMILSVKFLMLNTSLWYWAWRRIAARRVLVDDRWWSLRIYESPQRADKASLIAYHPDTYAAIAATSHDRSSSIR